MANLFPEEKEWGAGADSLELTDALDGQSSGAGGAGGMFGRSWLFDFEAGEFRMTPTRKIVPADETAAWIMWCEKAVRTARYHHIIYSRNYGQEYEGLIGRGMSREALESEIQRMTTEALMADPHTERVDQFSFRWSGDACLFSCRVMNVREDTAVLEGSVTV
ncbi:DUF2634 domain-containing protein [Paenibacillus ihumii]|uniref:DUF2634 domain-containing protein n=1 Tax=Paenibacillus ihumii TaxID=687436 RepID=UPI0006D83085|nr:DUF2634 domain-containing protein [Paenibacillus ihumii]